MNWQQLSLFDDGPNTQNVYYYRCNACDWDDDESYNTEQEVPKLKAGCPCCGSQDDLEIVSEAV